MRLVKGNPWLLMVAALLASDTALAEELVAPLSDKLQNCITLAQQLPSDDVTRLHANPGGQPYLSLSSNDSALTGCFLKFAILEKFSYSRCFEVAGKFPTPASRQIASQACFERWSGSGDALNCNWGANRSNWLILKGGVILQHDVQRFVPQDPNQTIKVPGFVEPKSILLQRCESLRKMQDSQQRAAKEAALIQGIQNSDKYVAPPAPKEIVRIIPNRPLSDKEKNFCALEATAILADFEALKQEKAESKAATLAEIRALLDGVPKAVRTWISLGRKATDSPAFKAYANKAPRSQTVSVSAENGVINVLDGKWEAIAIHATQAEDEAEIDAKILSPYAGGWEGYFRKQATEGCPVVSKDSLPPPQALADTEVKENPAAEGRRPANPAPAKAAGAVN